MRDDLDRYYTPRGLAEKIAELCPLLPTIEPCAGDGAIYYALRQRGIQVEGYDIDPTKPWLIRDARTHENLEGKCVCTNPPYRMPGDRDAAATLWRSWASAGASYIMLLLRLTWLSSAKSRRDIPPPDYLGIITPRPRFIRGSRGTDSADSALFCWDLAKPKGLTGIQTLEWER